MSRSQAALAGTMNITRDIFTTIPITPTGTFSFVESAMGILLFPLVQYYVVVKLTTSCGDAYSQPRSVNMPGSPNIWAGQPTVAIADKTQTVKGFQLSGFAMIRAGDPSPGGDNEIAGMIVSKNQGIHPNLVGKGTDNGHIVRNIPDFLATNLTVVQCPSGLCRGYDALWVGPPPVGNSPTEPVVGSTWYGRAFIDKTDAGAGGVLGQISAELSAVVQA